MNPFPVPVRRTPDSAEFFEFAASGALLLRRCSACQSVRGSQEHFCPACGAAGYTPVAASGTGHVVSWCVVHRSPVPGLEGPYAAAIVECDEGPWVLVRLLGCDTASPAVGAPVRLVAVATGENGESIIAAQLTEAGSASNGCRCRCGSDRPPLAPATPARPLGVQQ